jgi:alpha 1,6-mannosyltransferase
MIPKNIFQTHKSLDYIESNELLKKSTNSWKIEGFTYTFFDDNQCHQFIETHFPGMIEVYNRLPLSVMKADLWRYCIIYKYGGIYSDADTILNVNPNMFISNKLLMVVPENNTHFCQWVFSAPSGSPILASIISLALKRILELNEIKGEHVVHYLTGPGVFSDGIIYYLINNGYKIPSCIDSCVETKKDIEGDTKERNVYNYENNLIDEIYVFNHNDFHENQIKHLFSGQWENGWCTQRDKLLL